MALGAHDGTECTAGISPNVRGRTQKKRDKEVVGYLKGQRKGEDPNKICVYDVFGKEQLVQQHKSLPCPRQLKFPPNK